MRYVVGLYAQMKPTISTTALVAMLVGTGMLVFNALGLSISLQELAQT